MQHSHHIVLEHQRLRNVIWALIVSAVCFTGVGALVAAITGCAVAAGAAAGGAVGYVAGHEAGKDEARSERSGVDDDESENQH